MSQTSVREPWHVTSTETLAGALATDPAQGLTAEEPRRRLAAEGPNEIERGARTAALAILTRQFHSGVVWLLLGAGASRRR